MTPAAIVALVAQILALAPTLAQAVLAVGELKKLVERDTPIEQAELDAVLDLAKANSATIADMAAADTQQP